MSVVIQPYILKQQDIYRRFSPIKSVSPVTKSHTSAIVKAQEAARPLALVKVVVTVLACVGLLYYFRRAK